MSALLAVVLAGAGAIPTAHAGAIPMALTGAAAAGAPSTLAAVNYSPSSRTVRPVAVFRTTGSVANPQAVLTNQATRLSGADSSITLDFGQETGGLATLSFGDTAGGQQLGLSFTESSLYVGTASDKSANFGQAEGALTAPATSGGTYTMPRERLRGGFRYLTIFLRTAGWVDLTGVSLAFTAAPGTANPADYANFFTSNDELLNRIWYAGAYTVQLTTIAANEGRVWPPPSELWNNSATVGVGDSVMVDGAKRDRTVWPADLGVATPSAYAYTGETASTRNALTTMLQAQSSAGEIPWSGPQFNLTGSDTYHLWTLLMSATYYSYTGDVAWVNSVWPRFTLAMSFITAKIDSNDLLNVTRTQDWARSGQGGENISANALMYGTLIGASRLATVHGDAGLAATWSQRAAALKAAVNARLWVPNQGMYRDNPSSDVYPQDGNSLAVTLGLTDSGAKTTSIARKMAARWGYLGATTPEWSVHGFHPFTSALEVNAHFTAGQDNAGLAEIRKLWGYMLDSPIGTASTFWEGVNSDGGFAYGDDFTSLAHGWASGPTSALTFHVLGTAPEPVVGQYRFVPHPGDLTSVSGRITMPQGRVEASWSRNPTAGTYDAQLTAPPGTTGRIGIPKLGGNPTVTVGGATVWSNGGFTARPGITGGSQDASYIYLTGVAPGSYRIAATGLGNPPPPPAVDAGLPAGFTRCAGEGDQCAFTGNRVVAYGAGTYTYKIAGTGTPCTTEAFGGTDPATGLAKSCYVAPEGGPAGWTRCADENQTCGNLSNGRNVAYGTNGAFYTMVAKTSVACSNAGFGDPFDRLGKSCYVAPAGAPAGGWTQCATEGGACSAANGQTVAYGAYGSFIYTTVTGDVSCTNATFGEPVSGEVKACYTKAGGPNGFTAACATEGGTCTVAGTQTVAYGARGAYLFKTFTGSAPCTTAAFGSDPLNGVQKSCYIGAGTAAAPAGPVTALAASVCAVSCDTRDPSLARQDTFPVADRTQNGRRISLHLSDADAMAWGSIDNGTTGDSVWLDRTWDDGSTWDGLLGRAAIPATWTGTRTLMYNLADPANHRRGMVRACGDAGGVQCTEWVRPGACDVVCDGADPAPANGDNQPVPETTLRNRRIALHFDNRGMGWATLGNGTAGDEVWLDRSWDEGASWPGGSSLGRVAMAAGATSTRTTMFASRDPRELLYGGSLRACGRAVDGADGSCTAWARPAANRADAAADALMYSYRPDTAWWPSSWWNSAVAATTLMDYLKRTGRGDHRWIIERTFEVNRGVFAAGVKSGDAVEGHFISRAIDDSEWWAIAWIQAYDLTGDVKYLNEAVTIATYVQGFWDTGQCGGGVWWDRERTYKNAVTIGLYVRMTAALHNRLPGDTTWLNRATAGWNWFAGSGMVNSAGLVNDGINASCANNGGTVWTYNQGLAIGGALELWRATGNAALLTSARQLADAAMNSATLTTGGILTESCDGATSSCDDNQKQFKGIFMRYLMDLADTTGVTAYRAYAQRQADTIWQADRDPLNRIGQRWSGQTSTASPNARDWRTQASGLGALLAATAGPAG